MKINFSQYQAPGTGVQGPIGSTSTPDPDLLGGQTIEDMQIAMAQQQMDAFNGGLELATETARAYKQIKDSEDEIRILNAEEMARNEGKAFQDSIDSNEDVNVGETEWSPSASEDVLFTYKKDGSLGTHKHQDFSDFEKNSRSIIKKKIIDKITESGEIDEALEKKIEARIDQQLNRYYSHSENAVINRSKQAIDVAIQKKADQLYSQINAPTEWSAMSEEFKEHLKEQVANNAITESDMYKWVKKVDGDYADKYINSLFDESNKAELDSFFESKGKSESYDYLIWNSLDPNKKMEFLEKYSDFGYKIKQGDLKGVAQEYIDDPDLHGVGGILLLEELGVNTEVLEDGTVALVKLPSSITGTFEGLSKDNLRTIVDASIKKANIHNKSLRKIDSNDRVIINNQMSAFRDSFLVKLGEYEDVNNDGVLLTDSNFILPDNPVTIAGISSLKLNSHESTKHLKESMLQVERHLRHGDKLIKAAINFEKGYTAGFIRNEFKIMRRKVNNIKNMQSKEMAFRLLERQEAVIDKRLKIVNYSGVLKPNVLDAIHTQLIQKETTSGESMSLAKRVQLALVTALEWRNDLKTLKVPKSVQNNITEWDRDKLLLNFPSMKGQIIDMLKPKGVLLPRNTALLKLDSKEK